METLGGRYRIERPLGSGGAKSVFVATDERSGRTVALSVLHRVSLAAFEHEVRLAGRVRHAHVCKVFHAGIEDDGRAWIASELCEGTPLDALIREGRLDVAKAGPVVLDLADALAALHAAGVAHRDLTPASAVVGPEGTRLLDFGIGRPTGDMDLLPAGALAYRSPEALDGEASTASDVYALGVIFHELLTGRVPLAPEGSPRAFRERLAALGRHEIAGILPGPWRNAIIEMISLDPALRPSAIDVFNRLKSLFPRSRPVRFASVEEPPDEDIALDAPVDVAPAEPPPAESMPFTCILERGLGVGVGPEHVIATPWRDAPYVVVEGGKATAWKIDGKRAWSTPVPEPLHGGLTADLDKDGVAELYLFGPRHVVALDAAGKVRFVRPNDPGESCARATAFAHGLDGPMPVLVVDGTYVDHEGRGLGRLAKRMEGGPAGLVPTTAACGASFDGRTSTCHRGAGETPAAIGAHVSVLERSPTGADAFVNLCVYGPKGELLNRVRVATRESGEAEPPLDPAWAPLACARDDGWTILVPYLSGAPGFPPTVVAFDADSGAELWRLGAAELGADTADLPPGAMLADVDGDGAAELVFLRAGRLWVVEPHTGAVRARWAAEGAPLAWGDPTGTRYAHLLLFCGDRVEVWRGPRCKAGRLGWTGARADLWRTGATSKDGTPVGPR